MYEELGYPWSKFQDYIEHDLVDAMQSLHVETGVFVCLFVCLKFGFASWLSFCFAMEVYCYFLADNAVSMVKRYLSGLAKWASKQPAYKVEFPLTMRLASNSRFCILEQWIYNGFTGLATHPHNQE